MIPLLAGAVTIVLMVGGPLVWIGLVLAGIIWMSTWLWQVPALRRLERDLMRRCTRG